MKRSVASPYAGLRPMRKGECGSAEHKRATTSPVFLNVRFNE